jgi:hypothetical protein
MDTKGIIIFLIAFIVTWIGMSVIEKIRKTK